MMNPGFWRNKAVFVTGQTGFKGAWLSLWLQDLGAKVTGYALDPPSHPSLFELASVSSGMTSLHGDVRDLARLGEAIHSVQPEIVFHLAAQALVRPSYKDPVSTYATNIMGTVNLLESVRQTPSVKAVVVVTSDKCYENREWVWGYREDDPIGGYDPYSSSKGCAELVTAAYRRSFFLDSDRTDGAVALASARAGNVIGGGDWAEGRLVPDILQALLEQRAVIIRSPAAIRPWQHVLEPLHGYLMLAEQLYCQGSEFASAWNFGPDEISVRPVAWLVSELARRWGPDARWEPDLAVQPHEASILKLDSSKARSLLGWHPVLCLATALDWIVEWYREYLAGADVRQTTLAQIARFQAGIASSEMNLNSRGS